MDLLLHLYKAIADEKTTQHNFYSTCRHWLFRMGAKIMLTENIISVAPLRLEAQIFFDGNKRQPTLRPCDSDLYPEVSIECLKDLKEYNQGDMIVVDVVQMQSSNGHSYFYSY